MYIGQYALVSEDNFDILQAKEGGSDSKKFLRPDGSKRARRPDVFSC